MGGVPLDDTWDQYPRKFREGSPEGRRITRLDAVIQLVGQCTLELLNDPEHVDAFTGFGVRGEKPGEFAEVLDVLGKLFANVRTLNFHDDVAAIAQLRRVHLAQTGSTKRLVVELGEELADAR